MADQSTTSIDLAQLDKLYVECRECSNCGHVGINDSSDTQAACHNCDWTGTEPSEDHCPGCAQKNCMGAACPNCGAIYRLLAETELARRSLTSGAPAEPKLLGQVVMYPNYSTVIQWVDGVTPPAGTKLYAAPVHDAAAPTCPACQGNDKNMPCAYPSKGMKGCLRDERLSAGAAAKTEQASKASIATDREFNRLWQECWSAGIGEEADATNALIDYIDSLITGPSASAAGAGSEQGLLAEVLTLAETGMCHGLLADDYCSQIVAKIKESGAAGAKTELAQQGAAQATSASASEPERLTTDESREYLVKFTEQHFTDKTFHRYIRNDQGNRQGLAGDFAWQLARALRMIACAPAPNQAAPLEAQDGADAEDSWRPIETAPHDELLLLAYEFDRPGDWRIKVGGFWNGGWEVFGASWMPTRWKAMPAAPTVSDYAARRAALAAAQQDAQGEQHA